MTWTHQKFQEEMQKIADNSKDIEVAHSEADDLLCKVLGELGYEDGIKVYNDIDKRYA